MNGVFQNIHVRMYAIHDRKCASTHSLYLAWSVESRTETKLVPRSVKVNRRVPSTSRPSGQFKPPRVQSSVNNRHISSHNIDSKINSESVQISNIKNNDKPSPESGDLAFIID